MDQDARAAQHGLAAPDRVDHHRVGRRELVAALKRSGKGIEDLLRLGLASAGQVPPSKEYVWRNLALDVGHVLTYFVAHEAHHRGQIVMVARQTGHALPVAAMTRVWRWKPDPWASCAALPGVEDIRTTMDRLKQRRIKRIDLGV